MRRNKIISFGKFSRGMRKIMEKKQKAADEKIMTIKKKH